MIDWMHDLGRDWGRWMRKNPSGWPKMSIMGKIKELGSVGAAIRSHEQVIPVIDMPADVREFHNAWVVSAPRVKRTAYIFYVMVAKPEEKARHLGISKSALYQRLTGVHTELWSLMELQSKVQKV